MVLILISAISEDVVSKYEYLVSLSTITCMITLDGDFIAIIHYITIIVFVLLCSGFLITSLNSSEIKWKKKSLFLH